MTEASASAIKSIAEFFAFDYKSAEGKNHINVIEGFCGLCQSSFG